MTNVDQSPLYRAGYHAAHLTQDDSRAVLWGVLTDYLSRYIAPEARVLELGAGYCYWINSIRAKVKVAVDLWEELPQYAAPDVTPVLHDLSQGLAPFKEHQFTAVLASNVLEHFEPAQALQLAAETYRVLVPLGRFIIIQPNFCYAYRHYFDDYTHRSIFTHVSLPTLLKSQGFQIEVVRPKFMPYSLRDSRFPVRPWLIRAYLKSPFKPFAGQMLIIAQRPAASH